MANIASLFIRDLNIAMLSEQMRSLEISSTLTSNYEILAEKLDLDLSYDRIQLLALCDRPVKELLEHLLTCRPHFTVGELLQGLQRIGRNDMWKKSATTSLTGKRDVNIELVCVHL
jgi:hypothetical protein